MSSKCPHCGKVPYPAKNDDGSINWKNVFHVDILSLLLVLGILMLLFGMQQINKQCYKIVQDPCAALRTIDCSNYTMFNSNFHSLKGVDETNGVQTADNNISGRIT